MDALFFGTGIGASALTDTTRGFTLPVNDLYAGGRLKTTSYFAPDPLAGYISCSGTYNRSTGQYTTGRTWTYATGYTNNSTGVSVSSNISYAWSNGRPTKDITGLTAGSYSVTVTSQIGCTTVRSYTITQPATLALATSKTNAICYGASNGSASVSAIGGIFPYAYLWNTGATTASITNRPAGSYTVQVTDANGCSATASVVIGQPPAIIITSFSPIAANVGASVTIRGTGFTGATGVSFGGTAATVITLSGDTQIIAIVPAGALSGSLIVTNGAGCSGIGLVPFQFVASFATMNV
ncbi:MAG: hypothetical protein ACKOKF_12655, partial [Bacteroidota bacterium]